MTSKGTGTLVQFVGDFMVMLWANDWECIKEGVKKLSGNVLPVILVRSVVSI